jgi:hypothetical protein
MGSGGDCRHVVVVQLKAAEDAPGVTVFLEPEGGDRYIAPGDHLTITFDTSQPQEIEIVNHRDGMAMWRPMDGDVRVTIVDRRTGQEITDLW